MSGLMHDLGFGARMSRRSPGTTVAAALTLSLVLASLTIIFSLLNGIILRPLAYGDPERLVLIGERSRDGGEDPVPLPNLLDWKSQSRSFQGLAAVERDTMVLTGGEVQERITARLVSGELFGMLGVQPSLGRVFQREENAAVLTDPLWERRFGRDPGVIGRVIFLNDTPCTIVGVLPRGVPLLQAGALSRLLRELLFEVPVKDLVSTAGMASVLLAGTLTACYIPARRAARLDPATALRSE